MSRQQAAAKWKSTFVLPTNVVLKAKAIVKDPVLPTIEALASQDGVPRHLHQELQPPRRLTTTPSIGVRRASAGQLRMPQKHTPGLLAERTQHNLVALRPP